VRPREVFHLRRGSQRGGGGGGGDLDFSSDDHVEFVLLIVLLFLLWGLLGGGGGVHETSLRCGAEDFNIFRDLVKVLGGDVPEETGERRRSEEGAQRKVQPEQWHGLCDALKEDVGHVGLESVERGGVDIVDPTEDLLRDQADDAGRCNLDNRVS
jgi:hypothetical protein